jgi:hypothetical protein
MCEIRRVIFRQVWNSYHMNKNLAPQLNEEMLILKKSGIYDETYIPLDLLINTKNYFYVIST